LSRKSAKIAELIENCRGRDLDARDLGYFECFNRGLFYEAHDVLEELWLTDRNGPDGAFFKGLIQLAGAFVHLQKDRLRPAAALFKLAQANLRKYPTCHHRLAVTDTLAWIDHFLQRLEANGGNPLSAHGPLRLDLSGA